METTPGAPSAARKLDYGPLIDDKLQTIFVPETRFLRQPQAFMNERWWETLRHTGDCLVSDVIKVAWRVVFPSAQIQRSVNST